MTELEQRLNIRFQDQDLLRQVFVHRSYINEHREPGLEHNERLEFLGDAVLELVVTEYLYRNYPNPEGELTTWRSALVKGETLADVASELNFSEYLQLSHGETKSGGKHKNYLLANAFEAFIGALYLDSDYSTCQQVIGEVVLHRLPHILEHQLHIDPKSRLQEFTQQEFGLTPTYTVLTENGPDHAKEFTVAVHIGKRKLAEGSGNSKQAAQVDAARNALQDLNAS